MSRHDDTITMRQILDQARKALAFTEGKSLDDVLNDEVLGLALIRLLEVVGEAANRVSAQTRAAHPAVHWREWIDTRNRVIHGYDTVEVRIVFRIIRNNLPPLVAELERILNTNTDSQ